MSTHSESSPNSGKQSGSSCSITQRWAQNAQCAVRYVVADHVMTPPHPVCIQSKNTSITHLSNLFTATLALKQSWDAVQNPITHERVHMVPVLRLFGATPAGQKTCVFIHGVCTLSFHHPIFCLIKPSQQRVSLFGVFHNRFSQHSRFWHQKKQKVTQQKCGKPSSRQLRGQ